MKNRINIIAVMAFSIAISACEQHKKSTIDESGTEVVKIRTPEKDTLDKLAHPPVETMTVEGKIISINNGKDGYTAEIKNVGGKVYYVTISRSNLDNPDQYISAKVGDQLKVTGDSWKLDTKDQITVRKIN